ncbi:MAG: cysteine hydrolase [Rhizobiaceae bacterium]|nr:cysteine hydrolase [Rhizobiaceae bacterium]
MDLARTAILPIDLQNEYRPGAAWPIVDYDDVLANTRAVLDAARAAGVQAFHVQAWVEPDKRSNYARLDADVGDEFRYAVAGTAESDICEEVAPVPGEIVVRKTWPTAFRDTNLQKDLTELGIENLIVTGILTDSCVRATVFDAVYAGFRVWLVKDAMGSMSKAMHRTATLDMANRLYGGGVVTTGEAVKALRGEAYQAWRCTRPVEFVYEADTIDRLYEAL